MTMILEGGDNHHSQTGAGEGVSPLNARPGRVNLMSEVKPDSTSIERER